MRYMILILTILGLCFLAVPVAADEPGPYMEPKPRVEEPPPPAIEEPEPEPEPPPVMEPPPPEVEPSPPETLYQPCPPVCPLPSRPFLVMADVGVAIPTSELGTTFLAEVEVGYRFLFRERLGASVSFGYARPTTEGRVAYTSGLTADGGVVTSTASFDGDLDEMILGINVFYRFLDDTSFWTPWVSLGPGFFFLSHDVTTFGQTNTEKETTYGLIASAGVDFQVGPGAITAMFRYPWAPTDSITLGDTNVGLAAFQAGYRFIF